MAKTPLRCSICKGPIPVEFGGWAGGHNAEPVNSGRCCGNCNITVVIPARIKCLYANEDLRKVRKGNDSH